MNIGNIIVVLVLLAVLGWLVVGVMRSRRRAWVEREQKKKTREEAQARQQAELAASIVNSLNVTAMASAAAMLARSQADVNSSVARARVAHAMAQSQAKENARQHEA